MIIVGLFIKFIIFSLSVFVCFYVPGKLLLNKIYGKSGEGAKFLSIPLGIVIFTLLQFTKFLVPVILLILLVYYLKTQKPEPPKLKIVDKTLAVIILVGVLAQNSLSFFSGLFYGDKMLFWGVGGRDGVWYMALIESLKNNLPAINPSYAGEALKNYHYFFYLTQAGISKLTAIPVVDLNFRFFPLLTSLLFGLSIIALFRRFTKDRFSIYWALFFAYLSGSFGFIARIMGFGRGGWETAFWSVSPFSMSANPQLGFSFVLVVVWLIFLIDYIKTKNNKILIPLIVIAGTLPEFKIFGGTLVLASFFVASLVEIILKKKFHLLLAFLSSVALFLIIFLPSVTPGQTFLIFQPLWFIRSMFASPDRLYWVDIELKRQTFLYYRNFPKVILIEVFSILLFTIGNIGTKFIGFLVLLKLKKNNLTKDNLVVFSSIFAFILVSFLTPLLFLQKGVAWNIIQYFYYFVFAFALLAGLVVGSILSRTPKVRCIIFSIIIIILSLPTSLEAIYSFYSSPAASYVSKKEFDALSYLKNNTDKNSVILAGFYNQYLKQNQTSPLPLVVYDSTSYVSAFSGRTVYFADELMESIIGYDIKDRNEKLKNFFTTKDEKVAETFLRENKINYIYMLRIERLNQTFNFPTHTLNFKNVFENEEVTIFKTDVQ